MKVCQKQKKKKKKKKKKKLAKLKTRKDDLGKNQGLKKKARQAENPKEQFRQKLGQKTKQQIPKKRNQKNESE